MKQKQNRKRVFIFLLLACIAIAAFAAYAAFAPTTRYVKRVVAARTKDVAASNALRFSSNYLNPYDTNDTGFGTYPISVSSSGDVTIGITVCNYPQDDPSVINEKDITYSITMTILDSNGSQVSNSQVSIAPTDTQILKGNTRSVQVHKITIPQDSIEAISKGYIQVIATPDDAASLSATNNRKLAANLQIIPASATQTAWTDKSGDNVAYKDLDAYNCQISGTEQSTLTLSWNKELVDLSDWSIQLLNSEADVTEVKKNGSITFQVGGANQPTSYMLQFYRKGKNKPDSYADLHILLNEN